MSLSDDLVMLLKKEPWLEMQRNWWSTPRKSLSDEIQLLEPRTKKATKTRHVMAKRAAKLKRTKLRAELLARKQKALLRQEPDGTYNVSGQPQRHRL